MSERDEEFKSVQLEQREADSSAPEPPALQSESSEPEPTAAQGSETEEKISVCTTSSTISTTSSGSTEAGQKWVKAVETFKLKRFFVLRPGTLDNAIEDIKTLINQKEDGDFKSAWLMAEIDHWNNEKERVIFITEKSLLICKYDFIMMVCDQIQRVPLNMLDRLTQGSFTFPPRSLLTREGEGLRLFWDKLREPSLSSRWNPFAVDYPYTTLTYHPVRGANEKLAKMCEINYFREELLAAAQKAHAASPVPGKANGVLVLNQPILIEAYVGLMSFIGNQNKLGYCLARGNIGF